MKSKPFPELTDILLCEQCENSGVYRYEHKLEGAVYSPNLGLQKSIPRAINAPPPAPPGLKKLRAATVAMNPSAV